VASPFRHRKKERRRLRKSAKHWQAFAAQTEDKKPELAVMARRVAKLERRQAQSRRKSQAFTLIHYHDDFLTFVPRPLGAAGVCFVVGATGSILLGVP
jgi:hypothetical protein